MLYDIAFALVWLASHLVFRFTVEGRENIPKDKGYILAPNHLSNWDGPVVYIAHGRRPKLMVMAKAELFKFPPFGWLIKQFGAIKVERGTGDTDAVEQALEAVRGGTGTVIFPEGHRFPPGKPGRFKSGAFVVAAETGADIVPCRISYSTGTPKLWSKLHIAFGKPLSAAELGLAPGADIKILRHAKKRVEDAIFSLPSVWQAPPEQAGETAEKPAQTPEEEIPIEIKIEPKPEPVAVELKQREEMPVERK